MNPTPQSLSDLETRYADDEACLQYLLYLRFPDGYRCGSCDSTMFRLYPRGIVQCEICGSVEGLLDGTLLERSHKPLPLWFKTIWLITARKNGASAKGLQRLLQIGSYRTAWLWLNKLRSVFSEIAQPKLVGTVFLDEALVWNQKPGFDQLVLIMVELWKKQVRYVRMAQLDSQNPAEVMLRVLEAVEPGAMVHTDSWEAYGGLTACGFDHCIVRKTVDVGENLLPVCAEELQEFRSWLHGTHSGAVNPAYLHHYLAEYTFRYNLMRADRPGEAFELFMKQLLGRGEGSEM